MSATRYIATESAISAAINAALSVAFTFAAFGRLTRIPASDMVFDAIPQTFMVTLMATVVPTLLTRKRQRGGPTPQLPRLKVALPRSAWLRGLVAAVVVAALAWLLHRAVLPGAASYAFSDVLPAKAVYGAMLGATITALAVRIALGEGRPSKGE